MARTNKYSSVNFNDIYEKKVINSGHNINNSSSNPSPFHSSSSSSSSSASPNKTIISNSRIHGHMLVLSKPAAPKPIPIVIPQNPPQKTPSLAPPVTKTNIVADQPGSETDSISLRPQGRTGSGSTVVLSPLSSPGKPSSPLPKMDRFVPPHLRPGFTGREDKPGPEVVKGGQGGRGRGQFGYQNIYGEDGRPNSGGGYERPKSGGGYERMRRIGGEPEPEPVDFMTRPGSSGGRPSSSG